MAPDGKPKFKLPRPTSADHVDLDDVDAGWGDEEEESPLDFKFDPTPAAAQPQPESAVQPEPEPAPFELDDDVDERATAVPDEPLEQLAKRLMREAEDNPPSDTPGRLQQESDPPFASQAPPPFASEPPTMPDLSLEDLSLSAAVRSSPPGTDTQLSGPEGDDSALSYLDSMVGSNESSAGDRGSDNERFDTVPAPESLETGLKDMQDRYAVGDYSGALVLAEAILEEDPENLAANRYANNCRDVLVQMYTSRLGPLSQTAIVTVSPDKVRWLSLDHRAGFLMSLVDGQLTIEEILDISGMSRLDALRIMYDLTQQNIVSLR